jgi:rhodanese-related sulfurtransferase
VILHTDRRVEAINPGERGVEVVAGGERFSADLLLVAAGAEPETELARGAGAQLGSSGAVVVDEHMATSLPHLWAAGDCVESRHAVTGSPVYLPLGSLANRQGRTLANVLAGRQDRFPPVAGAAAVKVFDWNVGAVGCTRRTAQAAGLQAESVWICGHDRAHYYPEAREIFLHLLYQSQTGRVLGVQVAGNGDAIKRVDVATQLILRGADLDDLAALEHAYAPPYAPAVDPLAVAAWVAQNQQDGLRSLPPDDQVKDLAVLDVRHESEKLARPTAIHDLMEIPFEELRTRVGTLPEGRWLVVCERGGRSAEACRTLRQHGVDAVYLGGGLRWRQMITERA